MPTILGGPKPTFCSSPLGNARVQKLHGQIQFETILQYTPLQFFHRCSSCFIIITITSHDVISVIMIDASNRTSICCWPISLKSSEAASAYTCTISINNILPSQKCQIYGLIIGGHNVILAHPTKILGGQWPTQPRQPYSEPWSNHLILRNRASNFIISADSET